MIEEKHTKVQRILDFLKSKIYLLLAIFNVIILLFLESVGFLLEWQLFLIFIILMIFSFLSFIYLIAVEYEKFLVGVILFYFLIIIVLFSTVYSKLGFSSEIDGIVDAESGKIITGRSNCLYFSVVTFTTFGYGDLQPIGAARGIGAFEAFVGYFCMGLW